MDAETTDCGQKTDVTSDQVRLWDRIGLGLTVYTALSSAALIVAVFAGKLSGLLDDPMEMHPLLILCPADLLVILFSFFGNGILSMTLTCLPILGWLMLRKGSQGGRRLVVVFMGLSLAVAVLSLLLFCAPPAKPLWMLFLYLPRFAVPALVLNAVTVVAPATAE